MFIIIINRKEEREGGRQEEMKDGRNEGRKKGMEGRKEG